jgi:hypothetical protein
MKWILNLDHIAVINARDDGTAAVCWSDGSTAEFDKDATFELLKFDLNYRNSTDKGQFITIEEGEITKR